jgi:hypothetical protein
MKTVLIASILFLALPLFALDARVQAAKEMIEAADKHCISVMLDPHYCSMASDIIREANDAFEKYQEAAITLDLSIQREKAVGMPQFDTGGRMLNDAELAILNNAAQAAGNQALRWEKKAKQVAAPFLEQLKRDQAAAEEKADAARDIADAKAKEADEEKSRLEYKKDMLAGSGILPTFLDCKSLGSAFLYILGLFLLYAFGPMLVLGLIANEGSRVFGILLGIAWCWIAIPRALEVWTIFIILPIFAVVGLIKGAVKG